MGGGQAILLALLLVAAGLGFPTAPALAAAERVALVIGNGLYRHVGRLPNPANDARAISAALRSVGFEVIAGYDLDARAMGETIERFEGALGAAEVALVYYAGHGIGVDGVNYLLPVDAELETKAALRREAFSADWLLNDVMHGGDERVTILMLDACRNNPFARSFSARTRSAVANGLAEVTAKTGAYVAFATAPGNVASDGVGANSPFTAAVLRHLPTPGLEINEMMTLVRNDVHTETGEAQLPWASSALLGKFFFVPPGDLAAAAPAPAASPAQQQPIAVQADPEVKVVAADPAQPSAEELRLAALRRVENGLLPTAESRRKLQEGLAVLGHAPGPADGRFGPGTRAAIRSFQAASALEATGFADKPTLALLERQVARLAPEQEDPRPASQQRPGRSRAEATPEAAAAVASSAAPPPQAVSLPGWTVGVCTATAGGAAWASERHLTYDQCRKLGGSFRPF